MNVKDMTVKDLVDGYNFRVKLGANDGSAYIYCGTLEGVDISKLDEAIMAGYERAKADAQRRLNALIGKNKDYKGFEREYLRKRESKRKRFENKGMTLTDEDLEAEFPINEGAYNVWKMQTAKDIKGIRFKVAKLQGQIDRFTSVGDRKVVEIYKSIDEKDTYIVHFKGRERGLYWTTKEFENGVSDDE